MSAADRALEVFRAYEKGAVTPVTNVTGAKKTGNSRKLPIVTATMAFVTGSIKPVTNSRSLIELEIPNPVTAVTAVTSGKRISPSDLTIVAGAALAELRPGDPPCDIPHTQWATFIDDSGRFLASGWVDRAVALGWTALDLFGCDRIKPYARIDRMGLLWLLHGQDLLALSADAAAISTPAGGSLTFRKISHHLPGRVLAWQLLSPDDAHSE
jgi:hypothetical protein